jgi:hypothetical protein
MGTTLQEDEYTLSELYTRLAAIGYPCSVDILRQAMKRGLLPARSLTLGSRFTYVIKMSDAILWAQQHQPRIEHTGTGITIVAMDDPDAIIQYLTTIHAKATGPGVLMLAIHREQPQGWEPEGVTLMPMLRVESSIDAYQTAICRGDNPTLLPAMFCLAEPTTAIGTVVYSRHADILTRLPIPPRYLIDHGDVIEAVYVFVAGCPIDRARSDGRTFAKAVDGLAFPV